MTGVQTCALPIFVRGLGECAVTVLGNHDLHLITLSLGFTTARSDDTLDDILTAPDRDELITWLRGQPLLYTEGDHVLVHAGLLPAWAPALAAKLARSVETAMRGTEHREFFAHLYGSKPARWSDDLKGWDRLRVIVNAMTRMRFCSVDGEMEFQTKGETAQAPAGYMPWFDVPDRASASVTVVCGHWSALGLKRTPNLLALDTGCVWGGKLTAIRLEDRTLFQVRSRQQPADFGQ